jgi:hypothetical protein
VPIKLIDPRSPQAAQTKISEPTWIATPDPEVMRDAFPREAAAKGVTHGRGSARCVIAEDGALRDCAPAGETPEGLGFAQAAVRVAGGMRMNVWTAEGGPVVGATIRLPIQFQQEDETASEARTP